jgi:hypothetical protein
MSALEPFVLDVPPNPRLQAKRRPLGGGIRRATQVGAVAGMVRMPNDEAEMSIR